MVINIDSFSKSFKDPSKPNNANIIHRYNDSLGYKPLDLIKNTNPVVFIDEPSNYDEYRVEEKSGKNLNPLAIFRYSATHREKVNLMYKLDAVDAYEKKLVKQIEVGSIQTEGMHNQAYISLLEVRSKGGNIDARVEVDALIRGKIKRLKKWVKQNQDLEELTVEQNTKDILLRTFMCKMNT